MAPSVAVVVVFIAQLLVGCAHHTILPKRFENLEGKLPKSVPDHLTSDAAWRLDCISYQSQQHSVQPLRIVVGNIKNKMASGSDLPLPTDINDYIRTSLGRVTGVFAIHEIEDSTALMPLSGDALLNPATEINNDYLAAIQIQPHVVVTGALTHAERLKISEYEIDALGLSAGSIAEASFISASLSVIHPQSRQSLTNPRHMGVTTFTLTKGGSVLVLKDDQFVRGRISVEVTNPTVKALQLLADTLVADIATELIELNYVEADLSSCRTEYRQNPELYLASDPLMAKNTHGLAIDFIKPDGQNMLCMKVVFENSIPPPTEQFTLKLTVYRSKTFLVYDKSTSFSIDELLQRESILCVSDYFPAPDHSLSLVVYDRTNYPLLRHSIQSYTL